jgi:hypothetical protein
MKATMDTPHRLVLDDKPWLLGGMLIVAILVCVGAAMSILAAGNPGGLVLLGGGAMFGLAFVVFVRHTHVVFDRHAGVLTRRETTLRGTTERHVSLDRVRFAGIETTYSRRRKGRARTAMNRPVMHLRGDPEEIMPLNKVHVAGPAAREAADIINRWLGVPPVPRDEGE